jgi:hypothetical protein
MEVDEIKSRLEEMGYSVFSNCNLVLGKEEGSEASLLAEIRTPNNLGYHCKYLGKVVLLGKGEEVAGLKRKLIEDNIPYQSKQ